MEFSHGSPVQIPFVYSGLEEYVYSSESPSTQTSGYYSPQLWNEEVYDVNPLQSQRNVSLQLELNFDLEDKQVDQFLGHTGCQLTKSDGSVTITGTPQNVDAARNYVRGLAPLTYFFDIPKQYRYFGPARFELEAKIRGIAINMQADHLNVQVETGKEPGRKRKNFKTTTRVFVQGPASEAYLLRQLTQTLICSLWAGFGDHTMNISSNLEINLPLRLGEFFRNQCDHLRVQIMRNTSTRITFFDFKVDDVFKVEIIGPVHECYVAHQQILGAVPVSIQFEMPPSMDENFLSELEQTYSVQLKRSYCRKSVQCEMIIAEKYVTNLYLARRAIFGYDEPEVAAEVCNDYFVPGIDYALENHVVEPELPLKVSYMRENDCAITDADLENVDVRPTLKFLKINKFNNPAQCEIRKKHLELANESDQGLVEEVISLFV